MLRLLPWYILWAKAMNYEIATNFPQIPRCVMTGEQSLSFILVAGRKGDIT